MKNTLLLSLLTIALSLSGQDQPLGLGVSDNAPLGSLQNAEAQNVDLNTELEKGPLVLVFYRGQWCPYCNRHLAALSEIEDSLEGLGARIFAISPENPEYLQKMQEKSETSITLLYDSAYRLIQAYDLAFLPSKAKRIKYNTALGANLSEAHGDDRQFLPVPATFLIDQQGVIRWRHFDPDYTQRASPKDILKALKELQNS